MPTSPVATAPKPRRRRLLLLAAGLLLALGLAAWLATSATPRWYRDNLPAEAQARERLAHPVEEQLSALQTWSDATYVLELAQSRGRTLQVPPPPHQFTLDLPTDQLNALAAKWLGAGIGGIPLSELVVCCDDGSLRVAAKWPQWSGQRVLWAPLTETAVRLEVGTPRLGLLPLPRLFLPSPGSALAADLRKAAQQSKMDAGGKGSEAAQRAGGLLLARQLVAGGLEEDRCFLPGAIATPIAVRVARRFEPGQVTLTLTPLSAAERVAYLQELRNY